MTPAPPNDDRPDTRYSCQFITGSAYARVGPSAWPVVAPQFRAYNVPHSLPALRKKPCLEVKRSAKPIRSNRIKPHASANSP